MKERVNLDAHEDAEAPPPAYEEIDRVRTPDSTPSPSQLSLRSNSTLSTHSQGPANPNAYPSHPVPSTSHLPASPQPKELHHSHAELEAINPASPSATAANLAAVSSRDATASALANSRDAAGSTPAYSDKPVASSASASKEPSGSGQPVNPTPSSPFNFPSSVGSYMPPPPTASGGTRIFAFPQTHIAATAPFLPVYAPTLMQYGITEESWTSFINTITAFLTAQMSQRALHHAADVAVQVGKKHQELGKRLASNAAEKIQQASRDARKGNLFGVLGGTISLAVGSATRIVGHVLELPLLTALTSEPKTPRQRVEAYITTANEDWLSGRYLHALLVDSKALGQIANKKRLDFVEESQRAESKGLDAQLATLSTHFERLVVPAAKAPQLDAQGKAIEAAHEVQVPRSVHLGAETLWVVLVPANEVKA